jgi:hypothetical protein
MFDYYSQPTSRSVTLRFGSDQFFDLTGVKNLYGPGKDFHYGHRKDPGTEADVFSNADRLSGCKYTGIDGPGQSGGPGDKIAVDLEFRGVIVDVCGEKEEEKQSQNWALKFEYTVENSPQLTAHSERKPQLARVASMHNVRTLALRRRSLKVMANRIRVVQKTILSLVALLYQQQQLSATVLSFDQSQENTV